jgi:Family of unknown function (DUF5681)
MDDDNRVNNAGDVGYGRPPLGRRFRPGQSGNPAGRPPKDKGAHAIAARVFAEKQRIGGQPRGARAWYSTIELVILKLKQMAGLGQPQATKVYTDVMGTYGPQEAPPGRVGYLVVPERLTLEEWVAKYSPPRELPPYESE